MRDPKIIKLILMVYLHNLLYVSNNNNNNIMIQKLQKKGMNTTTSIDVETTFFIVSL